MAARARRAAAISAQHSRQKRRRHVRPSCRCSTSRGVGPGRNQSHMRARPGEVMGHLAFGHPFLDGNGRTLLLVHSELCRRAGFSIDWPRTRKADYLAALTKEIESPGKDILDLSPEGYVRRQTPPRWGSRAAGATSITTSPADLTGMLGGSGQWESGRSEVGAGATPGVPSSMEPA